MGHEAKYKKTIDGYLLDVCEFLNIEYLPRVYYKTISIEQAFQLSEATKTEGDRDKKMGILLDRCFQFGFPDPEKIQ